MEKILLQLKFVIVEFLNISYVLIPNPFRNCYLFLFGIKLGAGSSIHRNCLFFHWGKFRMGNCSTVNFGCYLDNRRGICIGDNVGIAHNTKIYTLGHNINSPFFETKGASVYIEDDVFVFANVLIMPGVTIKKGAIVLPGSVVTKSVAPYSIVGGNPAIVLGKRNSTINYSQKYRYWFAL